MLEPRGYDVYLPPDGGGGGGGGNCSCWATCDCTGKVLVQVDSGNKSTQYLQITAQTGNINLNVDYKLQKDLLSATIFDKINIKCVAFNFGE